jgi:hypothetical protein
MDTQRDATSSGRTEGESAITTIVRGEEVLEEAREVAQKISGRVSRAITERVPADDPREFELPAGLS